MKCKVLFVKISIVMVALFSSMPTAQIQAQGNTSVLVERVIPSKILYRLNEQAQSAVWLKNRSNHPQIGTLMVYELRGLDESREVARVEVTLAPNEERRNISVSWDVGPEMYGREIRADFVQEGEVVASGSEFFSVADDWLRVNIIADFDPNLGVFGNYINHVMYFAWAPDDFSEMTPEEKEWYSGQYGYHKIKKNLFEQLSHWRKQGIRIVTYAKFMFAGPVGYEFARQHPEWVVREKNGAFRTGYLPLSPIELSRPVTQKPSSWYTGFVDFYDQDAVRFGAEEIAASIRMFGWDGVFFDGHFMMFPGYSWDGKPTPHGQNPNNLSARNIRLCREIIRESFPDAVIWYNLGWEYVEQPFESTWSNHGGLETWKECLSAPNSGSLLELQSGMVSQVSNSPLRYWRSLYRRYLEERDRTTQKYGSVVNTGWTWNAEPRSVLTEEEFKASRDVWNASNYVGALVIASQLHPCFNSSTSWRPITQFMTRYSALLWDTKVKIVPNTREIIKVTGSRPLWWEEVTYRREGPDYVDYIIHLINVPENEMCDWKVKDDPPSVENVKVNLTAPDVNDRVNAWALHPYDYNTTQVPVQVQLMPEVSGQSVQVKVPPFKYYTMVVLRFQR